MVGLWQSCAMAILKCRQHSYVGGTEEVKSPWEGVLVDRVTGSEAAMRC